MPPDHLVCHYDFKINLACNFQFNQCTVTIIMWYVTSLGQAL